MKKRLLSLLLAMAMIVSMVPFQALAEEADETPALLETAEGIAPEDETTEVTIPETTEETVSQRPLRRPSQRPLRRPSPKPPRRLSPRFWKRLCPS